MQAKRGAGMYRQDSFFDLGFWGGVGLVGLSVTLAVLTLVGARLAVRRVTLAVRLAGSLAVFWGFVWLSPQVYYLYYGVLFPDLSLQWVIAAPPRPADLGTLLLFQGRQTLAAHGQGIIGWGLVASAILCKRRTPEP